MDFSGAVEKVTEFLKFASENQKEAQIRTAEINRPVYEKNIELEKDKLEKQHESWTTVTNAQIAKDTREFRLGATIVLSILGFLITTASVLLIKGEYQAAFPIITLLVGLIGGYGGAKWQLGQRPADPPKQ